MEIEKNIPMPHGKTSQKYVFDQMEVGDSVLYEADGRGSQGPAALAARNWGKDNGRKFSARAVDGGAKVRIWRIA